MIGLLARIVPHLSVPHLSRISQRAEMNSTKQAARIAGVLYLVNGVTGFFGNI
jgi:hypothetical protein